MKTYCFDIDGTICSDGCHYRDAKPYLNIIKEINRLFSIGNRILIQTSRGSKSGEDWFQFTHDQLKLWGVKHHELVMGKPQADVFIDDRAINILDWCKTKEISLSKKN